MTFSRVLLLSLSLTLLLPFSSAFSDGAGACTGGAAAVSGSGSSHTTNNPLTSGTLSSAGLQLTINGKEASTVTSLSTNTDYTLVVSGTTYKGVLIRAAMSGGPTFTDFLLTPTSSDLKNAGVCLSPVRGVTHMSGQAKTSSTATFRATKAGTVTFDITVVIRNEISGSNYRYSGYSIPVSGTPTTPVTSPVASPTSPSTPSVVCLSGINTVEVLGKGSIPMHRLAVGDEVKIGDEASSSYSKVVGFGHRHETMEAEYLQIHATGLKLPLEISSQHILLVNDSKTFTVASEVQVGDRLVLGNGKKAASSSGDETVGVVTKIETVQRRGLYAPATEAGVLQLNDGGVLVSSYVAVMPWYTPYWNHVVSHAILAPLRMLCRSYSSLPAGSNNSNVCVSETYDDDGLSTTLRIPLQVALYVAKSGWMVQLVATLVFVPIIVTVYLLEQTILVLHTTTATTTVFGSAVVMILAAAAVVGVLFWMKKQTNNKYGKIKMQ